MKNTMNQDMRRAQLSSDSVEVKRRGIKGDVQMPLRKMQQHTRHGRIVKHRVKTPRGICATKTVQTQHTHEVAQNRDLHPIFRNSFNAKTVA